MLIESILLRYLPVAFVKYLNEQGKITIAKLAEALKCSQRTIHRNMSEELKKEKELLNKQNEN